MTTARSAQIDLTATPYYHCMSRCVRGAYLCGEHSETGKDYSHRRGWIAARIKQLSESFAIQIAAYAVMSNHYHLVLHVNLEQAKAWQEEEIIARWGNIFPQDAKKITGLDTFLRQEKLTLWKDRLANVSWFMRCLNERIARLSNEEDDTQGRFWEGRFKSQALLDEGAVLSAMAYVDLNPIRAKVALTPEQSDFTSIQERIQVAKRKGVRAHPPQLMAFGPTESTPCALPFTLIDYLELVDTTGRFLREDKRGAIPAQLAPILTRLNLTLSGYLEIVSHLEESFCYAVGQAKHLESFASHVRRRSPKGIRSAKAYYLTSVA